MSRRTRTQDGFTLLEVLVAAAIFSFAAAAAMQVMANGGYYTASGRRARELRMLAERKLGEILTFEQYYDDVLGPDDFGNEYPEYGDRFKGWSWQLDVRDVVAFGIAGQETAQYLFGTPSEEEKAEALKPASGTGTQPGQPAKKGETQELRELILTVFTPPDEAGSDSVQLVTFMPLVNRKAAPSAPK